MGLGSHSFLVHNLSQGSVLQIGEECFSLFPVHEMYYCLAYSEPNNQIVWSKSGPSTLLFLLRTETPEKKFISGWVRWRSRSICSTIFAFCWACFH